MTAETQDGTRTRAEVPEEDTWNLDDIYPNREAWEYDINQIRESLPELVALKGTLDQGPDKLLRVMQLEEKIGELLIKVYAFATLANDEDTSDPETQAMEDRARVLYVEVSGQTAFIEPEIISLPEGAVERYLEEEADLAIYRHALESLLRQREHVLDSETESLLANAGEVFGAPGTIFGMINDADMRYGEINDEDGKPVTLTKANFQRFMESRNRDVRREAFESMHDAYRKQSNTLAATYASSVKSDVFLARARRYETALNASLDPKNIPIAVYDSLVETVNDKLPLLHRYIDFRKKRLGLDKLGAYDLYVPIVPEVDVTYNYDEAVDSVLSALEPLGNDYVNQLGEGLRSRWVDIYENQGKRSGAYSFGVYGIHPYILMNWSSTLRDVYTLAHEAGHAMHSFYTSENQPYVYGNYTLFVAEVASTVNEMLLTAELRKQTTDPNLESYLINLVLEEFRATLYRQTMFAEFERWAHERVEGGEALTADALSSQYAELARRYYGPDVEVDDYVAMEWARIPHFYRAYYVYQYATGISAAAALAKQILEEGEPARQRYRNFLAGGSSKYSLDLLKDAGVDMTTPQPVEQALSLFEEWLGELETTLG